MKGQLVVVLALLLLFAFCSTASAQTYVYRTGPVWYSTAPVYSYPVTTVVTGVPMTMGPAYMSPAFGAPVYYGTPAAYAVGPVFPRRYLFRPRLFW
jgi:hypothetical protein